MTPSWQYAFIVERAECYRHLWMTVILRHGRYVLLPRVRYV